MKLLENEYNTWDNFIPASGFSYFLSKSFYFCVVFLMVLASNGQKQIHTI